MTNKDKIKDLIKWLKEIKDFNAHDSGWIEETIKRLRRIK